MRTITLSEKHDKILEAIAPDWLRGERMTSRRIEWAINRLDILLLAENAKMGDRDGGIQSTTAGRPTDDETKPDEQA